MRTETIIKMVPSEFAEYVRSENAGELACIASELRREARWYLAEADKAAADDNPDGAYTYRKEAKRLEARAEACHH